VSGLVQQKGEADGIFLRFDGLSEAGSLPNLSGSVYHWDDMAQADCNAVDR
jgi:hypothetical protein